MDGSVCVCLGVGSIYRMLHRPCSSLILFPPHPQILVVVWVSWTCCGSCTGSSLSFLSFRSSWCLAVFIVVFNAYLLTSFLLFSRCFFVLCVTPWLGFYLSLNYLSIVVVVCLFVFLFFVMALCFCSAWCWVIVPLLSAFESWELRVVDYIVDVDSGRQGRKGGREGCTYCGRQ